MIIKPFITILIGLILPLSVYADTSDSSKSEITQLLEKVKKSKGDERRKTMNALKLKLRSVNAQTRAQTMQELRRAFGGMPKQHMGAMHNIQQMQQHQNMQNQMNMPKQMNPKMTPSSMSQSNRPSNMPIGGHP